MYKILLFLFTFIISNSNSEIQINKLNNWENCGTPSDHIHNLDISYTPEIISKGSNCFSYSYSTLRINKNERKRK